jgi:phosphohistidine phosphatase SixA
MDIRRLGMEFASMCNLMKAASLYAESIRGESVSFEYKNICSNIIRTQELLERKLKHVTPDAKQLVEREMDDDKIHYISETVLLMSAVNTDACKEIFETLKKHIEE